MNLWQTLTSIAAGILLLWAALVIALMIAARHQSESPKLPDLLRLVPDVIRLFRRLMTDRTVPRGVRIRAAALLGYLLLPIDVIPDFIPIVGYADDAVIVAMALRSIARRAGVDAIDRHWSGTPEGLLAVKRLVGLDAA
jgi:uncharacterized membrane protein YkvA (DUF1232 family)